jgi:hypothetical protein
MSSGPNPTTLIYNASVVNFYNATGSLARFENKNILFSFKNALAYYNAGVVAVCKTKWLLAKKVKNQNFISQ